MRRVNSFIELASDLRISSPRSRLWRQIYQHPPCWVGSLAFRWTFGDAQLLRAAFAKPSPETSHFETTSTETVEMAVLPVLSVAVTVRMCLPSGRSSSRKSGLEGVWQAAAPSTCSWSMAGGLLATVIGNMDSGEESVLPSEGPQMEIVITLLLATGQGRGEV